MAGIENIDENTFPINEKDPVHYYNSIVRCGEVEMYRLIDEARRRKADYVWVFPFGGRDEDCGEGIEGHVAYLINFKAGAAKYISRKYFDGLSVNGNMFAI